MCSCSLASQPYLHACTDSFALIDPEMIDSVSWTDDILLVPIAMSNMCFLCVSKFCLHLHAVLLLPLPFKVAPIKQINVFVAIRTCK